MSAYLVDKATIDAMITAFLWLEREEDGSHEPPECSGGLRKFDQLGAMLWRENVRSVNHRYNETDRTPPYRFEALPFDDMREAMSRVYGALRGYRYQACEHEGWLTSKACAWWTALEARVVVFCPMKPDRWASPPFSKLAPVHLGWTIADGERHSVLTRCGLSEERAA